MASRDLITFENGKYKRRVSAQETFDFLSVKVGASGLEISESTGAFDFASKKLTDIADAIENNDAPSWGQVKTYVTSQVVAGGTIKQQLLTEIQLDNDLGILPGLVTFLTVNAVEDDTIVLKDALGNTETYTFKDSASTDFEVEVGASIALSMSNLAAAINEDSAYWKAWYDVSVLDSIYPNGLIGIYRKAVGPDAAFKVWKTGTADGYVTDYHAEVEYKTNSSIVIALPTSEPETAFSGFSIAKADLQNGQIHNCIAEDKLKSWDGDFNEGVGHWMTMSEGAIPVSTSGSGGAILGKSTVDSDKGVEITGIGIIKAKIDNVSTYFDINGNIAIKENGVSKVHINSDVAGLGITQAVGGELDVNPGNGIEIVSDAVKVKSDTTGGSNLAKAIDVNANGVAVKVDDSTIEGDATTGQLKVKDAGVTAAKINSDVFGNGLVANITTNAIDVNPGEAIKIASDAVAVDFAVSKINDNAEAITVRQVVYVKSNGNVDLAQANIANLDQTELGLVEEASIATTAAGKITLRRGAIVGGFSGLTPGKLQYVSRATAGALVEVLTGFVAGEFVYSVGRAISTTEILFNPGEVVLEY